MAFSIRMQARLALPRMRNATVLQLSGELSQVKPGTHKVSGPRESVELNGLIKTLSQTKTPEAL